MIKIIVFILAFAFSTVAANKPTAKKDDLSTQSQEIIEIAKNLLLQKDRDQGIRILNKAQLTKKNKAIAIEIRSILKDIGSLFLFDKSQQEFESSISFKKIDPILKR